MMREMTSMMSKEHPGFKAIAGSMMAKQHLSRKAASAILASKTRRVSVSARRRNPRLNRVKM